MAVLIMAQSSKTNDNINNATKQVNDISTTPTLTMFHDFLGMKKSDSPIAGSSSHGDDIRPPPEPFPPAAASASSGGGKGLASTTSDMGSERQVNNHFEGVPYYGPRSDNSCPEISNRLTGSKRSNSDTTFVGSNRDGLTHLGPESHENLHLLKILRNGGGERMRRSNDEETFLGAQTHRQPSGSLILHPGSSSRNEATVSKWDRSITMNMGSSVQFPPRGGQFAPFVHHAPPTRFKDAHASLPMISQSAADEGSRTGKRGSGILSSINVSGGSEKTLPRGEPSGSNRLKSSVLIAEPESSSNPPSRHGLASASRQMTIFYGGQAHVFDDVHPSKADIIMALAGSNGVSWSTTYSPKSSARPNNEGSLHVGENETGGTVNSMLSARDLRGKLPATGNSGLAVGSRDLVSNPAGGPQGSNVAKDARNPVQAADRLTDDRREL